MSPRTSPSVLCSSRSIAAAYAPRPMPLPLGVPTLPQLAKTAKKLPTGDGWTYEPKWDGFRCIAFVDGDDVHLQSRNGKPLTRYFPELTFPSGRYVLDGEIVLFDDQGRQDFDALGQRIHPAASRIKMLSEQTPTRFIAFDLLARDDELLLDLPQSERRAALEAVVDAPVDLTPATRDPAEAEPWLHGAEGVIAKQLDAPYRPGERIGMVKIKRVRTMDAVVTAWRPGKEEGTVGSLILGLYGEDGRLRVVGHTSGFKAAEKRELVAKLKPYETGESFAGEPSRWNNLRELEGAVLRPELVVEVTFDHTSNGRIRHGAKIARWREDKDPSDCTLDQLQ
jgi:ATP-dependent DNA ligase